MEAPASSSNRQISATTMSEELLIVEILPKLPVKSLMRFKCVSKKWLKIITEDAGLREAHASHHAADTSFLVLAENDDVKEPVKLLSLNGDELRSQTRCTNPPEVKKIDISYLVAEFKSQRFNGFRRFDIRGYSNGLVLLNNASYTLEVGKMLLWNPYTREFRVLPESELLKHMIDYDDNFPHDHFHPRYGHQYFLGLGFDDKNDDHKVVKVINTLKRDPNDNSLVVASLSFQVFSSRANSWRKLEPLPKFWSKDHSSVSINGAYYFLADKLIVGENRNQWNWETVVMSFTYENDEVRDLISVPESCLSNRLNLVMWKEDSVAVVDRKGDFWVMIKNDCGNGLSWSKLFVLLDDYHDIRGVWSDRLLITVNNNFNSAERSKLVLLDPLTGDCLVIVEQPKPDLYFYSSINYVPSLVSVFPSP